MTEIEIKTEDKAWFTMLPNIIDDDDLDPYAFRLYVHLRRVAGDKGRCWQSTKTLAAHCLAFEIDPDTAELARQRVAETQPPLPGINIEQLPLVGVGE